MVMEMKVSLVYWDAQISVDEFGEEDSLYGRSDEVRDYDKP